MLTAEQVAAFARDGFLVIPGVVPDHLLSAADAEIDQLLRSDPPPDRKVGPHFYFLGPSQLPAADAALRRSGALAVAEQLVSPHRLDHAFDHIQVALNIPPYPHRPGGPHIDGHRPEQDRPDSFTMLAAVFLADESAPDSGNLWVWPGSHLAHQEIFAERGTRALLAVSGHTLSLDDPPPLGKPRPVLARRGDLLLAHFLLGHNIGGNVTERTRRILYYRLSCPAHHERWEDTFRNAFREYPAVQAIGAGGWDGEVG
ncbi:MAG: phytanoyl-CoA dioxygenase family protein [Acidobacteriota bacterium]|nr:phytanoyl-CoA dioxygenase family protein [Acidobacteriota bacterium]